MRNELAERVYPVFRYGLELRQRFHRGEQLSLAVEQSALLGLLTPGTEQRAVVDYDGDRGIIPTRDTTPLESANTSFLGSRYALVCWLDELFVLETPRSEQWNEHKLEVLLYASNDRAWRFWTQARIAAARGLVDALEVYYMCAMLGFRGEMRDQTDQLEEWFEVVGRQIRAAQSRMWNPAPDLLPLPRVPVLRGRGNLRTLLATASISVLLVVPMVTLLLLRTSR